MSLVACRSGLLRHHRQYKDIHRIELNAYFNQVNSPFLGLKMYNITVFSLCHGRQKCHSTKAATAACLPPGIYLSFKISDKMAAVEDMITTTGQKLEAGLKF